MTRGFPRGTSLLALGIVLWAAPVAVSQGGPSLGPAGDPVPDVNGSSVPDPPQVNETPAPVNVSEDPFNRSAPETNRTVPPDPVPNASVPPAGNGSIGHGNGSIPDPPAPSTPRPSIPGTPRPGPDEGPPEGPGGQIPTTGDERPGCGSTPEAQMANAETSVRREADRAPTPQFYVSRAFDPPSCEDVEDPVDDTLDRVGVLGRERPADPQRWWPSAGGWSPAEPTWSAPRTDEGSPRDDPRTAVGISSAASPGRPADPGLIGADEEDLLEALAVAALAAAVLVPLVLLYRRLVPDEVLENENRRRALELIEQAPGATPADVARELDVDYRTARHHLDVLEEFDHVERQRTDGRIRYYENHQRYAETTKALASALDCQTRRSLLRELLGADRLSSGELARRTSVAPSTVSYHLGRLASHELVSSTEDGRETFYELEPEAKRSLVDLVRRMG